MTPQDEQKLEQLVHQALRDLPARRAPRTLEMRVLAAIEQQAALPWWRKSFQHWPVPVRIAFVFVSAAIVAGLYRVVGGAETSLFPQFRWVDTLVSLGTSVVDFSQAVLRSIPPLWLYGGLAFVATLYAALFGLGAAAYRALYATR
jgi:hypothetical protein